MGNWAPANLGTSWDDLNMNAGFAGLSQNKPTNPNDRLDFNIQFKGEGVQNLCAFKKSTGEYCNGNNCGRDVGCTVSSFLAGISFYPAPLITSSFLMRRLPSKKALPSPWSSLTISHRPRTTSLLRVSTYIPTMCTTGVSSFNFSSLLQTFCP